PLRRLYLRASNSFANRPLYRAVTTATVLIALAPLVRLANALAARRDSAIFSQAATSMMVRFAIKGGAPAPVPAPGPSDCPRARATVAAPKNDRTQRLRRNR